MKKFLLLLGFMIFTGLGAHASTTVYYQNTGVPLYIQRGAGPRVSIHSIQSNPHMRRMMYRNNYARPYGQQRFARDRYAQCRNVNNGMPPMGGNRMIMGGAVPASTPVASSSPVQVSRFDKGSQPRIQKSYSRGGMVYYN